jgi:(S)-sulfolactate dehydrogenase
MRVLAFDPYVPADDPCWAAVTPVDALDKMLRQSDAVSLHVPLTDDTHHLIDAGAIAQMKEGAVIINASRGGVLDEKALVDAIRSGRINGAALDVYENEPLSATDASLFADLPNLILTPHIGGVTVESNERVSRVTIANVLQVLETAK